MLDRQLYVLAVMAACFFGLLASGCGDAGSEKTDANEVVAIEELETRAERNYMDLAPLIEDCENVRETFFDCMVENVEPHLAGTSRSVRPGLRRLAPRVGPTCERWIRAVLRGLEEKQIFDATVYEDLDAVALACRDETRASNAG
jgi:hypothetical protein